MSSTQHQLQQQGTLPTPTSVPRFKALVQVTAASSNNNNNSNGSGNGHCGPKLPYPATPTPLARHSASAGNVPVGGGSNGNLHLLAQAAATSGSTPTNGSHRNSNNSNSNSSQQHSVQKSWAHSASSSSSVVQVTPPRTPGGCYPSAAVVTPGAVPVPSSALTGGAVYSCVSNSNNSNSNSNTGAMSSVTVTSINNSGSRRMSVTPSSTGAAASHYHPYARSTVSAVTNNGSGVNYSGNSTPTSSIARMSINHNQQRHQQYAPPQPPPPPPPHYTSSSSSSNVSESVVRHESSPSHHHQYAGQQQYPQSRGYSTTAVSGGGGSNLAVSYIPRVIPHPMSASSVPLASLPPLNGHPMHPHPQPAPAPLQSTGGHSVNGPVVTMHGHANTESTGSGYLPTAGTLSPGSPPSKEDLPPMPMQLPPYDPAFVNSVDAAIVAQRNLHYRTATTPPASRTSPLGLGNANIVDDGSDYGDNGSEIGSIKTASDTSVLMQHVQVGRPSKRAGGPTLTSEQRRERRLIRNREAARVCRKKRKDHTERLEDENKTLRDQILNLRSTIATMQAECKCESATRGHQHQHQHHQHQHQNLDDQYLEPQQPQQYSAVPSPPLAQMGPMEQPLPMRHQHQLSQPTPQYAFTTPVKPFAPAGTLMTTPSSAALANSAAVGYAPVSPVSPDN